MKKIMTKDELFKKMKKDADKNLAILKEIEDRSKRHD